MTILCGLLYFSLLNSPARSQDAQQITAVHQGFVRLEHTRHPLAIDANAAGHVEGSHAMSRMLLILAPPARQDAQLPQLLDDQQNRQSPNYHHWLTPAQFGAQFGAADADVQSAVGWLQSAGFTVERIAASKRWVEFSGTAAQVENAFQTVMQYYHVNGKIHVANSMDLSIPVALNGIVRGVVSLNSFGRTAPVHPVRGTAGRTAQGRKASLTANLTASGGPTNTYYVAPGDFATIYDTSGLLKSGIDGTGISIAVTAQSDITLTDVQQFRQIFGLKENDPNFVWSGPDPGVTNPTDAQEALLDVEWAGAAAPGATINLVIAGSTDTTSGVDLSAAYAIDNAVAPILTYTYGSCEQALGPAGNAFYNALWQQAAAEGITVFVASGDNGAAGCDNATAGVAATQGLAVNGVASTPFNVAVGGTEFADADQQTTYWSDDNSSTYSSAVGYIPEAAWNESCDPAQPTSTTNCVLGNWNFTLLASAGGASTWYGKPAWQTGTGVPADSARDLPDVALAAATGHDETVYCTSLGGRPCQIDSQQNVVGLTLIGGTSVSTPAMAGILALIEQKNGGLQGQINYVLYPLAQVPGNSCNSTNETSPTAQSACVFYDVTAGNNQVPCAGGSPGCSSTQNGVDGFTTGQVAGVGYDMVTGLGSVNATNLALAWKDAPLLASQTTLQASSTSFVHGTAVVLSGNVIPASGTGSLSGSVALKTNLYGDAQPVTLNAGAFSAPVTDLPGGQYTLYAYYAGNATYASSESPAVTLNVTPENSTTTVAINGPQNATASYGAPLQIKVTAAGLSGQGVATGTVTIQDGANVVGTSNLAADGAAYLLTGGGAAYAFAPGTHALTAAYSGDNSFNASTSSAVNFTVAKGTPFVVLGINQRHLTVGQTLGVHAVVAGQGTAMATGTVQFTVDGNPFGTPVPLQTGGFFGPQAQASLLISNLTQGVHVIGAAYNGNADANYNSVASGDSANELTQTVQVGAAAGTATTTALLMKTAPVNLGDTGVFTVTVSPSTATGTVTLWDAVGPRTAATAIGGGTATVQFAWPQAGSTSLYAVYSGDANDASSASAPVSFSVQKGASQVAISGPSNLPNTGQISLNVSVSGAPANPQIAYPTGTVQFWDSVNGAVAKIIATQVLTAGPGGVSVSATRVTLGSGSHGLSVRYLGDTNWQAATSAPLQAGTPSFTLNVAPNPIALVAGSPGSGTVTITPSGGFTGTVALACATGGTNAPAGYTCSFGQSNVPVNNAVATTSIAFTLSSSGSATSAAKTAAGSVALEAEVSRNNAAATGLLFSVCLLGLALAGGSKARNYLLAVGLVVGGAAVVWGCGGGGGGGGGSQFSTTTTIVSNAIKAPFGTPVTFSVTVKPNGAVTPNGMVQLYDNGQAYLSPVSVTAGVATFLAASLPIGVHNLSASYLGDAHTLPSQSAPIQQAITGQTSVQITGTSGLTQTLTVNISVI